MRFRPLRPASAPDAAPRRGRRPTRDDARRRDRRHRRRRRAARGLRRRAHARPQRAARARRRRGHQPDRREDPRAAPECRQRSPQYPAMLGFDFSGIVVRSPYESHPLPPGTPVFGMVPFPRSGGSYAEYAVVPSLSVARKPTSLSHVEAAGVPLAALTAWGLVVETAHAHEGQRMLIHAGSGGVGHFAVQFAAYFGAHVTATGSSRNASWLRELGASVVIDYTHHPLRGRHRRRRRRHRPRRQRARRDRRALAQGACAPADCTSSCRPARGRATPRPRPTRACGPRATRSSPTAARSPPSAACSTPVRCRSTSTGSSTCDDAAAAHAELEQGHTRGKIVLRVSDD